MQFNSRVFVAFFAIVLAVYYALPREGKLWFLLVMSYVFYGFWDPWLCLLMAASTLLDYVAALSIDRAKSKGIRDLWLGASLVGNLGALFYFKYTNFFLGSFVDMANVVGVPLRHDDFTLQIALPIGISFYTFQTLSYTIEVWKGNFKADRNFRDFALYVSFFPQLVAGPVERATHLLPQYKHEIRITRAQVMDGVLLILLGFTKKVVIGDRLALWIDEAFARAPTSGPVALMSLFLFTTNIYVDFSAYSDIAIGLGRLLGYDIRPNFNLPFVVPSIPERWRRWHISMGHWFRDYVYFPLGGNRHGVVRSQINVFLVMLLSGLWHGASYSFLTWGILNGLAMVGHKATEPLWNTLQRWTGRHPVTRWGYYYLACTNTFVMISLINIFFRSDTWDVALDYVHVIFLEPQSYLAWAGRILGGGRLPERYADGFAYLGLVVVVHELERWWGLKQKILARPWVWAVACVAMWVYILLFGIEGPLFIYFQF
jgi:D-alanyl-lipoteichoic acid acyltransferase DltB (MBOAT superfamily)